jgi:hypothetical protein
VVRRGRTIPEKRWPDTPDFVQVAKEWRPDAITVIVKLVWEGYDLFTVEVLSHINCDRTEEKLEQIERSITQSLERRIRDVMTGDEPFGVQHEVYEWESGFSAKAQPPQYDIAFFLRANERIILPLEAKVLNSDGAVGEYIDDVQAQFLTCRYAPFSSEGGMLGYLLSGEADIAFRNIEKKVPCTLSHHQEFIDRNHKTSDHIRKVPSDKLYPANFRCHHLILKMVGVVASAAS